MGYSTDLLSWRHHFRFAEGLDGVTQFRFTTEIYAYNPGLRESREKLSRYSPATTREIITDAPFETMNQEGLEKLGFLFGDAIKNTDEILFEDESKWLHQTGDLLMFLPYMK